MSDKLSIDDFRYKDIESAYKEALKYDASHFFDLTKQSLQCPLCQSDAGTKIHELFGFSVIECACDFMYALPRPSAEEQHDFYQNGRSNMLWHQILGKTRDSRKRNYVNNIVPLISKYISTTTKLVDIGCGKGIWLDTLHEVFPSISLSGVEPFADDEVKTKYNIITSFLENMTSIAEFDICSLMSIIEHTQDPLGCLKKCHQILKDDGLVFVTAPNMRGFDAASLNAQDRNWEIPQHINFFDVTAAERCVKMAGFEVVESGTFGFLDVDIISKSNKHINNDFLRRLVYKSNSEVKNNFQKFLTQNGLSGQLYIVARKIK